MRLRKIIFWLHLTTGIIAGSIVLIMSVTGVLLAFERQIIALAERDLRVVPQSGALRLSLDTLLARVRAAESQAVISGLTLRSDSAAPTAINLGRERTLFVDPYTGAILGEGAKRTRNFFHSVTDFHRWLGTPDEGRAIGRAITGACNLAFLFLVVSGFYLWWPRKSARNRGRAILMPRARLRDKARDFNWHNAIGFWCAPVLFFLVLSGVLLSYPWTTSLLYRLTGSEQPSSRAAQGRRQRPPRDPNVLPQNLDRLWSVAERHTPNWQTINVRFGDTGSAPVNFSISRGAFGRPDLRSQLTLDPKSGEVISWETFSSFNLGRRLRTWARFVHTGEAGGVLGQAIAALASAGAAVLVCTGLALAWRRFRERKHRDREVRAAESVEVLR